MERYNPATLIGIINNIERPKRFLLELFFPREMLFTTEEVYFDKILGNRRLAPFVSPYVKGKPMPVSGAELKSYRPPYLKPKHPLTPDLLIPQVPGLQPTQTLSLQQKFDRARAARLQEQDDQIARREEWMASTLLRTGALTVDAEDHPTMVINLGRPSGQTVQLTSAARWGETGVSPLQNIRTWGGTAANSSGVTPRTVVMDPLAAALFRADPYISTLLNMTQGPQRNFDILGTLAEPDEAVPIGQIGGFSLWEYQSTYLNADGSVGKYMPDYTVIMGSPTGAQGVRAYGAIMDFDKLQAASRFPKEWREDDPSVHMLMTQSAPLPLLGVPDATFCATVR